MKLVSKLSLLLNQCEKSIYCSRITRRLSVYVCQQFSVLLSTACEWIYMLLIILLNSGPNFDGVTTPSLSVTFR